MLYLCKRGVNVRGGPLSAVLPVCMQMCQMVYYIHVDLMLINHVLLNSMGVVLELNTSDVDSNNNKSFCFLHFNYRVDTRESKMGKKSFGSKRRTVLQLDDAPRRQPTYGLGYKASDSVHSNDGMSVGWAIL